MEQETPREYYIRIRDDEIRKYEHAVEVCQTLIQGINDKTGQVTKLTKEIDELRAHLAEAYKNQDLTQENMIKFIKEMRHYK